MFQVRAWTSDEDYTQHRRTSSYSTVDQYLTQTIHLTWCLLHVFFTTSRMISIHSFSKSCGASRNIMGIALFLNTIRITRLPFVRLILAHSTKTPNLSRR